ncbi:BPSL1445 family SYLF domain-containing lipoprotein [Chromobacterium haemolyticum]|uniref:BPSL1445 family SYLF domain-containing lipoprotein n=1 Tax=Chromobacterium haemolyticum TaxID=394935 RepID=UPI000DEFB969|nr:YSC84-related protein [Chromobacterium haemolyticum]
MLKRIGMILLLGGSLISCTTTSPNYQASDMTRNLAIDANVDQTLSELYQQAKGSRELMGRAKGVLVFPSVLTAGLVVGAAYGEGQLRIGNQYAGYYKTMTGSVGFQAGAQSKAIIFLFMTEESLDHFRKGNGWTAGVDANVVLLKIGADGSVDTETAKAPVIGFVLTNGGLMFNVSLQGTKVSKLKP